MDDYVVELLERKYVVLHSFTLLSGQSSRTLITMILENVMFSPSAVQVCICLYVKNIAISLTKTHSIIIKGPARIIL